MRKKKSAKRKIKRSNPCFPCNPSTRLTRFNRVKRNPDKDLVEQIERDLLQIAEKSASWGTPNWQNWDNFRIMIVNRFEGESPSKAEIKKFLDSVIEMAGSVKRSLDFGYFD